MQRLVQRVVAPAILVATGVAAGATTACRLDPLVDDKPGASANILPKDTVIPGVASNADLTNQIVLNDSLDSDVLKASGNVIPRASGGIAGDGTVVHYWAFGDADRAPAPIYVFGRGDPTSTSFAPLAGHPPLVEAVPGDGEYEPIHTIFRVAVTGAYADQKITTPGALADAIDLQLVQAPVAIKVFVNWPIVRPGTRLDVGAAAPIAPTPVYAHGYIVDSYPLGGALGMQPNRGLLPTSQVSFLREQGQADFDRTRPIFQASIPPGPPAMTSNYTPLSVVVNVDLKPGIAASTVRKDSDLFTRSALGDIMATSVTNVLQFTVTTDLTDLQIQFADGAP